jgi:hypothetical protein
MLNGVFWSTTSNLKAANYSKQRAGDGDRTRDVQLGNMSAVCLSKTSLFNTFIQVYGIAPKVANWPVFVS